MYHPEQPDGEDGKPGESSRRRRQCGCVDDQAAGKKDDDAPGKVEREKRPPEAVGDTDSRLPPTHMIRKDRVIQRQRTIDEARSP